MVMKTAGTSRSRIAGCLVGGAIGDGFGSPYEGMTAPVELAPDIQPVLTDDTVLTLATCEAILAEGRVDPAAIAARCAAEFRAGRVVGIGAGTYKALSELAEGGHWALCGSKGDRAAGNGAAMRIAPVAFFLDLESTGGRRTLRDVARITHQNEEAYVGALAVALAVRFAWQDGRPENNGLMNAVIPRLPDSRVRDRLKTLAAQPSGISVLEVAEQCGTSGYVVESVPMAIWAAQSASVIGFETMIRDVIRCSGDTDTIASMAGQIAGTFLGVEQLPESLLSRISEREMIRKTAERFAEVVESEL